jgi:hypothetical protein
MALIISGIRVYEWTTTPEVFDERRKEFKNAYVREREESSKAKILIAN